MKFHFKFLLILITSLVTSNSFSQNKNNLKYITTFEEFQKNVLNNKKPVMVKFFAPWCGPCKKMAKIINEVKEEYKEKLEFFNINISKSEIAQKYQIMSVPTIIFFFKGKEQGQRIIGASSKAILKKKINNFLETIE